MADAAEEPDLPESMDVPFCPTPARRAKAIERLSSLKRHGGSLTVEEVYGELIEPLEVFGDPFSVLSTDEEILAREYLTKIREGGFD